VFYAVVVVVEEVYDVKLIQTFRLPRRVLVVVVCIDLDLGIVSYHPYYLLMMLKIVAVVEEIEVA
jgi:hypothetical protein